MSTSEKTPNEPEMPSFWGNPRFNMWVGIILGGLTALSHYSRVLDFFKNQQVGDILTFFGIVVGGGIIYLTILTVSYVRKSHRKMSELSNRIRILESKNEGLKNLLPAHIRAKFDKVEDSLEDIEGANASAYRHVLRLNLKVELPEHFDSNNAP